MQLLILTTVFVYIHCMWLSQSSIRSERNKDKYLLLSETTKKISLHVKKRWSVDELLAARRIKSRDASGRDLFIYYYASGPVPLWDLHVF